LNLEYRKITKIEIIGALGAINVDANIIENIIIIIRKEVNEMSLEILGNKVDTRESQVGDQCRKLSDTANILEETITVLAKDLQRVLRTEPPDPPDSKNLVEDP
jgi:hypothetical protein